MTLSGWLVTNMYAAGIIISKGTEQVTEIIIAVSKVILIYKRAIVGANIIIVATAARRKIRPEDHYLELVLVIIVINIPIRVIIRGSVKR